MNAAGTRIKELRIAHHMTQKQLSLILNLSQGNLSELENNHIKPSLETLFTLSHYFKVSIDWLVNNEHVLTSQESKKDELILLNLFNSLVSKDKREILAYIQIKKEMSS